jgi:hypothetical protein
MDWSHYDAATHLGLPRDAHLDVIDGQLVAYPMGHRRHRFALSIRR